MSEDGDGEDEYGIGTPLDDDYIDVEKRRADVSISTEEEKRDRFDRDSGTSQESDVSTEVSDMSYRFDVGDGNGAASEIDELIDQNAIVEHDGRASTRTFYYVGEVPDSKKRQFGRMLRWQEGEGDSGRAPANRQSDRERTVSTFCSFLDMGTYQRERIQHICDGLNMSHMAHYSSPKVILATITLVANEDGRFIRDEDGFRKLLDDTGSDLAELRSIRNLVRKKSKQYDRD